MCSISCTISWGTGTGHLTVCGWVPSIVLSSICARICGMRSAISSTCGHIGTTCSVTFMTSLPGLATHGSTTMQDFHLSWDVVVGSLVVLVVLCGACSVSYPQSPPRREHGYTVGIDRDPPVGRLHRGKIMGTSERQPLCAWLVLACRTAHVDTVVGGRIVVWCC